MNKVISTLLLIALISLTGCFEVIEEMHLNRNGSGKYTLTFDMSGLFSDPFMKSMLEEAIKEEGLTAGQMEVDTVIYMKNAPDSVRQKLDRPDFLDKIVMRSTMSESRKKMITSIELNFDTVDDIEYFYKNLDKIGAGGPEASGAPGPGLSSFASGGIYSYARKKLTREPVARPKTDQSEEMEMMRMFLGEATHTAIYHLPGKVRKTTMTNADIDGKTVTVTTSYLDLMDGKSKLDGEIRFRN